MSLGGDNSKQIDASAIGGGGMLVTETYDEQLDSNVIDKTYDELVSAVRTGIVPFMLIDEMGIISIYYFHGASVSSCENGAKVSRNIYTASFARVSEFNGSIELDELFYYSWTADGTMTSTNPCENN